MNEDLIKFITAANDESNKKKVICQCAATIYGSTQDVNQSIKIATQIVDQVYV